MKKTGEEGNNTAAAHIRRTNFENLFIARMSRSKYLHWNRHQRERKKERKREIYVSYACWHVIPYCALVTRASNPSEKFSSSYNSHNYITSFTSSACQWIPKICIYFWPSHVHIRYTPRKKRIV